MADTAAKHSLNWRRRPSLALFGVVAAYAAFNVITSLLWPKPDDEIAVLLIAIIGVFVLQPMIIGVWLALGSGSWLTRLPIAVPCFLLLLLAPAIFSRDGVDIARDEFIVTVLAGLGILVATSLIFSCIRWFTRFRIASDRRQTPGNQKAQFNIRYLLILTALCAVVLGILSQIKFQADPPRGFLSGLDFFVVIVVFGGSVVATALLPTLSIPLFILHGQPSRRAIQIAFAAWIVISGLLIIFLVDQEDPLVVLQSGLIAQSSAALAGALTALFLRWAGVRLVKGSPNPTQEL
jgi:hypothetical protein